MKFFISCYILIFSSFVFAQADSVRIKSHLNNIISIGNPRSHIQTDNLNRVADYVFKEFNSFGDSTYYQNFEVENRQYKNVITSFGDMSKPRIIVGAHYDVCGNQDGADDNASGVAALLELARLLNNQLLNYRIDLVAYSLEEPPYFGTDKMGSYKHAEYLFRNNIDVYGMICLDMIGYFSNEKGSQDYPLGLMKLFYGGKGDYITVVKKIGAGKFAKQSKRKMKHIDSAVKVKSFTGPAKLNGIAFSDHLNYWRFGYSALFITDTGFFRNPNYHLKTDTLETLSIQKITEVTELLFQLVSKLQ